MTLNETVEDNLTNNLWRTWKQQGTETKMTWLEIHKLACALTKMCREASTDYQQIDFQASVDSKLTYYENLSTLEELVNSPVVGMTLSEVEELEKQSKPVTLESVQNERDRLIVKCGSLKQKIQDLKEEAELEKNKAATYWQELQKKQQTTPQPEILDTTTQQILLCYDRWAEQQIIEAYEKSIQTKPEAPKKSTAKNALRKTAKFLWKVIY